MPDAIYNKQGRLVARDGYIVPLRIGCYMLDSPFKIELPHPVGHSAGPQILPENSLCMGVDAISWRLSYPGGTVEKKETLLDCLFGEDKEECGASRNAVVVHPRVITFLSDQRRDESVDNIELGQSYKLRNVFRTKSTVLPVQQTAKPGERYPEMIKPHYEHLNGFNVDFRIIRPSFRHAIKQAEKLKMLYEVSGITSVAPDYEQLARDWEALKIHPAIIQFYCIDYAGYKQRWRSEIADQIADNPTLTALMDNLEYSETGLHQLLQKKLSNDEVIRELLKS